jgi:hypothetical protein
LVRLAFSYIKDYGFARCSATFVPELWVHHAHTQIETPPEATIEGAQIDPWCPDVTARRKAKYGKKASCKEFLDIGHGICPLSPTIPKQLPKIPTRCLCVRGEILRPHGESSA